MRKIFSILTFGILFLPMVQMCESKKAVMGEAVGEEIYEITDTTDNLIIADTLIENDVEEVITHSGRDTIFPAILLSGYELIKISALAPFNALNPDNREEFTLKDWLNSLDIFLFFPFAIISVLLLIFSFLKKYDKTFLILSIVNLIILIAFFVSFIATEFELSDVKYGFYLLVLNSIMIVVAGILHKKNKPVNFANLVNLVKKQKKYV